MDKRLLSIYSLIKDGVGVADVGTDHAYLPVYLAQNAYHGNIIASDINVSPLASARKTIIDAGLEDRISLVLCDGLRLIEPESIDTVVIAGMGGDLICGILDATEWLEDSPYHLILQPMTKSEVLRYWLVNNGYSIDKEVLVEESSKIYQVISASSGRQTQLCEAELFLGKYELVCKEALFSTQLEKHIERFKKGLFGMANSQKAELAARRKLTELIYAQLLDIRKRFLGDKNEHM